MTWLPGWWTIIAFVVMAIWNLAITVYDIRILKNRLTALDADVKQSVEWGRAVVAERAIYNEKHYLTIERFNECTRDMTRRLDEVNTLDLSARLSAIETELKNITRLLNGRQ